MKILKFSATWCNPCKALKQNLSEYAGDYEVVEYDADTHMEEFTKFGIRNIPTLIAVNDNDEVMATRKGAVTLEEFEDWIKSIEDGTVVV